MKVIVIGSGLIGVATAYFLRHRGCEVTVVDRQEGPGRETSFANGGLLTPSMAEPWNTPGCWRELLLSLGRSDAALQVRLHALPSLANWAVAFLRSSSAAAFERNALSNLRLALHSLRTMESLRKETGIEYGRTTRGSLRVFRDLAAFDHASTLVHRLRSEGLQCHSLSVKETINLEPALGPIASQLKGAVHYESDEIGDAYRFCIALTEHACQQGVRFRFGTEISSLHMRGDQVVAALSRRERLVADRYIVAAGSYSTRLLQRIGVHLPVCPVKGYSLTLACRENTGQLGIPIIDDQLHAAVVPLGRAVRVAGTAEFAGYDLTLRSARIRNLLGLLQRLLPQLQFDVTSSKPWCGLRAMSTDGVPIIGATPLSNLFVNTGHGHLGWTMAAGSARLVSELMTGATPSINAAPFALARFGAA